MKPRLIVTGLLLSLIAPLGCSDLSGRARPSELAAYRHPRNRNAAPKKEDEAPRLTISLEVLQGLGIARYVERIGEEEFKDHGAGLIGVIRVTLTNTSDEPLILEDLGSHNLVFRRRRAKEEYVIVHEDICARLCRGDPNVVRHLELEPGESRSLRFEHWGRSDAWELHPPSGAYRLSYRIREMELDRRLMPGCSSPLMTPIERVTVCKRNLKDPAYWRGAFQGPEEKVRVAPAKVVLVP